MGIGEEAETGDDTFATEKKRSRRVSFAEKTSVHVFDRDDSYDSPSNPPNQSPTPQTVGFLSPNQPNDDDHDEEDSFEGSRILLDPTTNSTFLRPLQSPSTSSTFRSDTSSHGESFFGPVSANFLKPGRFSGSATSDDHEITMDSTSFSMHFHSIARSDILDEKTPSEFHLSFADKTLNSSNPGSSMDLTKPRLPISLSQLPQITDIDDSNDMNCVVDLPLRFDFGKLSPRLDAILTQGAENNINDDLNDISISTSVDRNAPDLPVNTNLNDVPDASVGQTPHLPSEGMSVSKCPESINHVPEHMIVRLLSPINNTIDSYSASKLPDSDLNLQCQSRNTISTGYLLKEALPNPAKDVPYKNQNSSQMDILSLEHSITLLDDAKQKAVVVSRCPDIMTPSSKHLNSSIGMEIEIPEENASCIKTCEASNILTPRDKIFNSKLTSSNFLFKISPCRTVLQNTINPENTVLATSHVSCSEKHSPNFGPNNEKHPSIVNSSIKSETKILYNLGSQSKSPHHSLVDTFEKDEMIKVTRAVDSSPQVILSGVKVPHHLLNLKNSTEEILECSRFEPTVERVILDNSKDTAATTPENFLPSVKINYSSSRHFQGSLPRDTPKDQYDKLSSDASGHNDHVLKDVPYATESDSRADELGLLFNITTLNPSLSIQNQSMDEIQNESGLSGKFQTPVRNRNNLGLQSVTADKNLLNGIDSTWSRFKKEHPEAGIKDFLFGSDILERSLNERDRQGLFEKDLCKASSSAGMHLSIGKEILSTASNQRRNQNGNCEILQELDCPKKRVLVDFEYSLGQKKSEEMDEFAIIQSTKIRKVNSMDLKHQLQCTQKIGGNSITKHWTDFFANVAVDAKQLLFPSIEEINFQAVGVLEDIVAHMHKVKMYELLCSESRSQISFDPPRFFKHKRVAEARSLLYKMMYSRAKLMLLDVKRDRLLKRVHVLKSGIEMSQNFKLIISQNLSTAGLATQEKCTACVDLECDVVTAMKQLDASDRKVKNLTKLVCSSYNMKEKENCVNTIVSLKDHLKKRMSRRIIRQDLQLWEVDNLEAKNSHHCVVLSYRGLILQRIMVNAGPVSSISVKNKLNDTDILKNFPNLDALIAFAFVLNAESTQKYGGPRSLARETQVTSSLVSTLLDVVEEVQLAKIELRSLCRACFHSSSAKKLDLELQFIDFKCGRQAILSLDMTCLNRGVYPSEILPSQIEISSAQTQDSQIHLQSAEIRKDLGSLRAGFFRIIRICRRVSTHM